MPLDPVVREQYRAALRQPGPPARSMAERRAAALRADEESWAHFGLDRPEVTQQEVTVPVTGHPDVRLRILRPDSSALLPGVVHFFGGGFQQGGIDYPSVQWSNSARAHEADVAIVAVDYALAPEHRYPTQIEQGYAALAWLRRHGADLGIDSGNLAISGQSSGGSIAASVAVLDRDRTGGTLRLQLLEVPVLDLTTRHMRFGALRSLGVPGWAVRREYRRLGLDYLGGRQHASDPVASPLLQKSLAGLPPTSLLLAEYDVLRGDGEAFHAALREAGVPSSCFIAAGLGHDSAALQTGLLAARDWHAHAVSVLRRLHD